MAITILGEPQEVSPSHNPLWYYFDSTNKNGAGFRYVVDIYAPAGGSKIAEFRLAPRPVDGYGEIDIRRVVSALLSADTPFTTNPSNNAANQWVDIDVKIGEETQYSWAYGDYEEYTGGGVYDNYTQLREVTSTTAHTYVVGDQINVAQSDGGLLKPAIEGLHTVVLVPNAYTVVIDLPFSQVGAGADRAGVITYADGRKVIVRDDEVTYTLLFNAAFSVKDFPSFDFTDYELSAATPGAFLTDAPNGIRLADRQPMWLSFLSTFGGGNLRVIFENSNGDVFRETFTVVEEVMNIAASEVGAGLTTIVGTPPLVKPDTTYYDIYLENTSDQRVSEIFRVNVDKRCAIEDYVLVFFDRKGGWGSFRMMLKATRSIESDKKTYKQQLGGLSGGEWTYAQKDRGMATHSSVERSELLLNSNYLTDEENIYFEQLLTSRHIYLYEGAHLAATFTSVIVDGGKFDTQQKINTQLFRREVTVRMANNNLING